MSAKARKPRDVSIKKAFKRVVRARFPHGLSEQALRDFEYVFYAAYQECLGTVLWEDVSAKESDRRFTALSDEVTDYFALLRTMPNDLSEH